MAEPVVLPADVIQTINMIKATPVDPNDFQNAIQECFNRGFGKQGQWIMDHKDLYLLALQNGYVVGTDGPKSEHPSQPPSIDNTIHPPIHEPADALIDTTAADVGVDTSAEGPSGEETTDQVSPPEASTGNNEAPGEEPEGRKRKSK